jgi:putative addiction module killer protein
MDVVRTASFEKRLLEIADARARSRINVAAQRMRTGNFGDSKSVGHGVVEARLHYGPGYRIYFTLHGAELVLLLLCGDKRTQQRDIARAIILSETLKI